MSQPTTTRIYILPGMGADKRMYPSPWDSLSNVIFLDWPIYRGEKTIPELAQRLLNETNIQADSILIGSSLGGMVFCEIARLISCRHLILIGSAVTHMEINPILARLHPLARTPLLKLIQHTFGRLPFESARMFRSGEASFIQAMCHAIFNWEGLDPKCLRPIRIHGKHDLIISRPRSVDCVLNGGHLISMTHATSCLNFIRSIIDSPDS